MLLASATKNKSPDISSSNAFLVQRLRASSTALVRLTFGQCRLPENVIEQVEIQVKYQGYIDRQNEEIDSRRDIETLKLPEDIDIQQSQRFVGRSAAKAQPAQTRNRWTGKPNFRHHTCRRRIADGAFETRI